MRRVVAALISLSCLAAMTLHALAAPRGCTARPSSGSSISKRTLTIPTFLEVLTAGVLDASVGITLHKGHSLNLGQACDCTPPCEEGKFQYTGVRAVGTTSAFGGEVKWIEEIRNCKPGPGGAATTMSTVSTSATYTSGRATLRFSSLDASIVKVGMKEEEAVMTFSFDPTCRCQDQPCPDGSSYPKADATPEVLHLIRGETGRIHITATDEDGDLQPECIRHALEVDGDSPLVVEPPSGGGPGGPSSNASFIITCRDTPIMESQIRFAVWDEQGNSTSISIPVAIWRGGPSIEIIESETGWEGDAYAVRFRLDDPDFADCDVRSEVVTWGVRAVRGGSVMHMANLPWIARETCSSQEAAGSTSLAGMHAVIFVPSEESGEQQFTILAEDAAGHRTEVVVTPNRRPIAVDDPGVELKTTAQAESASVEINVLGNDSDPDGDSLVAITIEEGASGGTVTVNPRSDESPPTVTYTSRTGFGGIDTFTYRASDGELWSNPATVTVNVITPPLALPLHFAVHPHQVSENEWLAVPEGFSLAAADHDAREGDNASDYIFRCLGWESGDAKLILGEGSDKVPVGNRIACFGEGGCEVFRDTYAELRIPDKKLDENVRARWTFNFKVTDPDGNTSEPARISISTFNRSPTSQKRLNFGLRFAFDLPTKNYFDRDWYEAGCVRFRDPDGDPLTFSLGRRPRYGNVGWMSSGSQGNYEVTLAYEVDKEAAMHSHRTGTSHVDRFSVVAKDPFGATAKTDITVRVDVLNRGPTCQPDHATTDVGVPVTVSVLSNDTDLEDDTLTVIGASDPAGGGASVAGSRVRYTPDPGFFGTDGFSYTVSDGHGGTATGGVTVEVVDPHPPVFHDGPSFGAPIVNDPGLCSAVVSWAAPIIGSELTDNLGIADLECSKTSGTSFAVGRTSASYTATDLAGNKSSYSFDFEVIDSEPPTFSGVPNEVNASALEGESTASASWSPPSAADNCCMPAVTSSHDPGDAFPIGTTQVAYTATDIHGNEASVSFPVIVASSLTLGCTDVSVTTTDPDGTTVSFAPATSGGCLPVTVLCSPASGSHFPVGTTSVHCTATDICGGTAECTFNVTVELQEANRPPTAMTDYAEIGDDLYAVFGVTGNDSDPDGDVIWIKSIGSPSCGDADIVDGDTPQGIEFAATGCHNHVGEWISIRYTIQDEHGATASSRLRIKINYSGPMPTSEDPEE